MQMRQNPTSLFTRLLVGCAVASGVTFLGCSSQTSVGMSPEDKAAATKQLEQGQPVKSGRGTGKVGARSIKQKVFENAGKAAE